jgi:hypothetical protein
MPSPPEPKVQAPSWLVPLTLALAALLLLACFSTEVSDSDTFWHLATGRYILQNHRLPVPDPFSWATYLGKLAYEGEQHTRYFNLTHEWLAQVYLYLVYAVGGYPGMVLMRALLTTLICAGVSLIVWRRTQHLYLAIGAALLFLGVQYDSPVMDRPLLLTLVLLVAVWLILEQRGPLRLLPVLFLIWGNVHGAYIMGWALLAAYCAEDYKNRRLLIASAAAVLATGLNPNGFRAIQVLLLYQQSALQSQLIEWTPPALWPPLEMFTIVLYAAGILLIRAHRTVRRADWMLYLFFAAAAARASRNIVFLSITAAIMITTYFPWKKALPLRARYAVAAALALALGAQIAKGRAFELRSAEWRFPSGAGTFLQQHHVTGRMFNIYGAGGYLIWRLWPQQKVMVDGRALNERVNMDATRIINYNLSSDGGESYQQLLDKYGIEVIVADGFEYYTGRPWWLPVNLATLRQDEWKLVYHDPTSVVFMRHPPEGVAPIFPPEALKSFEAECMEHLARDKQYPGCAAGLARTYAGLHDIPKARKWGLIYLEHEPNPDPKDKAALQQLQ